MKLLSRFNFLVFLGCTFFFIISGEQKLFAVLHLLAAIISLSVGYKNAPYWLYLIGMVLYFALGVFLMPTSRIALFDDEGTLGLTNELWRIIGLLYAFLCCTLYFFSANAKRLKYKGAIKY